jgi:hypothetical protein
MLLDDGFPALPQRLDIRIDCHETLLCCERAIDAVIGCPHVSKKHTY